MGRNDSIGTDIRRRVTYRQKIEKDFQRAKDIIDVYDNYYGYYRNEEQISNYDVNYDLMNGRLDVELYEEGRVFNIGEEKVTLDNGPITHYPLISQIVQSWNGMMINRPFRPMVKDLGTKSHTLRKRKTNELLKSYINQQILAPLQQQIVQQYMQQNQVSDPYSLTPEQQAQMRSDINRRMTSMTPGEILQFMQKDYRTPTEKTAQRLLDYFKDAYDLKQLTDDGFKHSHPTGREIYRIDDRHGLPRITLVNPKYFNCGGSKDIEWYQHKDWAKSETWLTFERATQDAAEFLGEKDYKALEDIGEPIGGYSHRYHGAAGDPERDRVVQRTMYELSQEHGIIAREYGDINIKTKKGQGRMRDLYASVIRKYGGDHGQAFSNYGIREVHVTWRDKRKMFRVRREERGRIETYWMDEHYEPSHKDLEVDKVWLDEVWEGTKWGTTGSNDIYFNIRPVPGQYKSIYNPFDVELPYVGKEYNTHMNNTRNVSVIDLGKPWQKEFDTTMAELKHDMASDIGKVFLMTMDMKPENWTWSQFFTALKEGKVGLLQNMKHGMIDPNLIRGLDLGKATDIANKIQLLEFFRAGLVRSMFSNDATVGSIGQYTNSENIKQSMSASYNQSEHYFETHRRIVEKALGSFMNRVRIMMKDNPNTRMILSDLARIDLEQSPDFLYESLGIDFQMSSEQAKQVDELRAQMLTLGQNGMGFKAMAELAMAKTESEVYEIMAREQDRQEKMRQEEMAMRQQEYQAKIQAEQQEKQAERMFELQVQREKLRSQTERVLLDREKFRMQADADRDGRADTLEKAEMDNRTKLIQLMEEKKLEWAQLQLEYDKLNLQESESELERDRIQAEIDKLDTETASLEREMNSNSPNRSDS